MNSRFSDRFRDIAEVRDNWGWFLALGVLLVLLGIAVISSAFYATWFSVVLLGAFLTCAGIVQIVQAFLARRWNGLFLSLLLGVLYIITGFFCLTRPSTAIMGITLWIAAFCFIAGIFRMLTSVLIRFDEWGWVFFNGLVTFCLGAIIYTDWPISGLWVIGTFVGVDMILSGWSWILLAFSAKSKA